MTSVVGEGGSSCYAAHHCHRTNCIHRDPAVWQEYELRVNDEFVLRGNAGLLKCLVPSYVSDVVQIEAWQTNQGETLVDQSGRPDWGKSRH